MAVKRSKQSVTHMVATEEAIRRAVASSTAVETGQSVESVEAKIGQRSDRYKYVRLAD